MYRVVAALAHINVAGRKLDIAGAGTAPFERFCRKRGDLFKAYPYRAHTRDGVVAVRVEPALHEPHDLFRVRELLKEFRVHAHRIAKCFPRFFCF